MRVESASPQSAAWPRKCPRSQSSQSQPAGGSNSTAADSARISVAAPAEASGNGVASTSSPSTGSDSTACAMDGFVCLYLRSCLEPARDLPGTCPEPEGEGCGGCGPRA